MNRQGENKGVASKLLSIRHYFNGGRSCWACVALFLGAPGVGPQQAIDMVIKRP